MKIEGAEEYHALFADFLNELIGDDWQSASIRIFFFWKSGAFRLDHFYMDVSGEQRKSEGSIIDRDISTDPILKGLIDLKNLTIEMNQAKWNVFEFDISKNDNEKLNVYWDSEKETLLNPTLEPDEDSFADALLNAPELLAKKLIRMDYTSDDSLKPWYYIQNVEVGIKSIVQEMIEEGSELEMRDFELIDFNRSSWRELEKLIQTKVLEDSEFKIMLDGTWDRINRRYSKARFTYNFKGTASSFDIEL